MDTFLSHGSYTRSRLYRSFVLWYLQSSQQNQVLVEKVMADLGAVAYDIQGWGTPIH